MDERSEFLYSYICLLYQQGSLVKEGKRFALCTLRQLTNLKRLYQSSNPTPFIR